MALFKSSVPLLITIIFSLSVVQCCEKITFVNSITAASLSADPTPEDVLPITMITGCLEPSGNGLEEAVRIAVMNSSVSILYPEAVKDLTKLETLNLDSDGIQEIAPGAFQNLPSLKTLTLVGNKIKMIPAGVFNGLTVSFLSLSNNSISAIDPTAFDNMPNLRSIEVEFNKITMWSPSWFTNTPNLVTVSFGHNKIVSLPGNAFANIKATHELDGYPVVTSVDLSNNKISTIDSLAFQGMGQLGYMDLHKNSIKMLPPNVFSSLTRIGTLILDGNKLECLTEDFLNSLPPVNYISANGNAWNCTCLDTVKTWSKMHGGVINVQLDDMDCTTKKMKGILDFVQNIKDMKTKFASMKFQALANATGAGTMPAV